MKEPGFGTRFPDEVKPFITFGPTKTANQALEILFAILAFCQSSRSIAWRAKTVFWMVEKMGLTTRTDPFAEGGQDAQDVVFDTWNKSSIGPQLTYDNITTALKGLEARVLRD